MASKSKFFESNSATKSKNDERHTVFRSASGINVTSDVQDEYAMRDAIA